MPPRARWHRSLTPQHRTFRHRTLRHPPQRRLSFRFLLVLAPYTVRLTLRQPAISPPRPLAVKIVFIFMIVFLTTYPQQPIVGLEFTFAYMLAGMTMGLTMVLPIVLGVVSAWYLNEGYEWARVVIIIEGALRMLLDIVVVALFYHVFLTDDYSTQAARVMFFGPFMTLHVFYAKIAFDFISRILIIVLLCQPQVGRYIHMRGDLRRMSVK